MNKIGNWPTRALYGFVALAMVLSLVLMGAVLPTAGTTEPVATEGSEIDPGQIVAVRSAEAGPDIPELLVYIERPTEGTGYNVGDWFYVNAVVAYKAIEGTYPGFEYVTATIDTGNNAALVYEDVGQESKSATILRNCVGDFWWKVQCTGEGNAIITVTATASGLPNGQASVTVIQGTPRPDCDLEISIVQPEGNDIYVDVCDDFVVKARVENKSSVTATDVNVSIDIDPDTGAIVTGGEPLSWDVGDILVGKHVYVLWNVHCEEVGTVNITVDATAGGVTNICPAYVIVYQGEEPPEEEPPCGLDVTVFAPEEICTVGCNYSAYQVTATITNTCSSNCTNITATISKIAGGASASIDPPLQQDVGTLMPAASQNVTWNVTCIGLEAVTFKVVAQGVEDDCVGEDTAIVQQKKILIELIEPESAETIYHNICQTFNVTVNITNCDCFPLENVIVQLDVPESVCITQDTLIHVTQYNGDGELVDDWYIDPDDLNDPEEIPFSSFCACCIYQIEWIDLHCCEDTPDYGHSAEEVYIRVWDDDVVKDEDYFRVMQTEKAHLAAGVEVYLGTSETSGPTPWDMSTTPATAIAVNQSFVVVIPVINMGMADAEDVSVNVTITGNASCAGNHTFDLGTIEGRTAKKAFISCNCTADGSVEIYISGLSGNDSIKKINHPTEPELYEIPEDNIYDCGYRILKQIPITIEIIQPSEGENFTCSDDFVVKVRVANESEIEGNDLTGVTATVTWTGPAEFNPGAPTGYATKSVGDLKAGNHTYIGWNFHCYDTGDVTFTVTIESTDPVWSDYRTVTVHQIPNATLTVEILSPRNGASYGTSEEFAVTAKVTVASATNGFVTDVWAYIGHCSALEVLGSSSIPLYTMTQGESQIVSWTVHAVAAGMQCDTLPCIIGVQAIAPCAQTGYYEKTVTIYPAANLVVEIIDAPEEVVVCETFDVTARVTNVGWADATGVKLLLSVIPDGSVRPVQGDNGYEQTVGTLVGYGQQYDEMGYEEVTWTLHCKVACESTIIITPVGYDECGWHFAYPLIGRGEQQDLRRENGYLLVSLPGREIEDRFLTSDSVTVKQVEATQLVMDITFPADGAEFQEGDSFVVTGTVKNIGEETATDVTATLTVDANASITGAEKDLDDIAGGQAKVVSWSVECENAGYSLFTATAEATNADDALDTVTVKQGAAPAAQIVVDITYPGDGAEFFGGDEPDTFVVTAKVTNIGEQTATNVQATIAIRAGDPAALVTPPDATQIIASIPGGETKSVTWNLVAGETTGSAVITVTAVGPNTALDVVTVKINPAPVQMLFEGANPIAYQGETSYLPEALTNITDKLVIIWQRDATTGGAWHTFYFYSGNPMGEIEKLVENSAYIMVVSENCGWNLVH